jgi:GNAT superfamily N-acetyltransferase
MMNFPVVLFTSQQSEKACRSITASLPEWFAIPEANDRYALGVKERTCFGILNEGEYLGMVALEFPFENNASIYWMGVKKSEHGQGIGKLLLEHAEKYCLLKGCTTLTVETLSPKEGDKGYLKTYDFYNRYGFKPLFELHTYGQEHLMVYLCKFIQ